LPSSEGPSTDSNENPAPVSAVCMTVAACSAVSPTANEPDAGPCPVSVGTASGGSGNDAGGAAQMRPRSVSCCVGGDAAAAGEVVAEPPGTGVWSGAGDADAAVVLAVGDGVATGGAGLHSGSRPSHPPTTGGGVR